jgi:N-terminal domain of M60-like peptidases/Peptidase M60, enhancin and enhancin-like
MKIIRSMQNAFRSLAVPTLALLSMLSSSCGGGSANSASAGADPSGPLAADVASPAFDLKGFKFCGKQGDTLDLKVKTHVAFGLESDNRYVYLYAQTGKLLLSAETFGNDPIPSKYKEGYCKVVTADNNDAVVFAAAMAKIKAHIDGSAPLTDLQLQEQNDRITQTTYTLADSKTNIAQAFAVLSAYETKEKGAFFINAKTKNGFPNYAGKTDGFELDRSVLALQQSVFDYAFTPAALASYRDTLAGLKFNSADWFPGKVKSPAAPAVTYTVKVNATMAKDVGLRTAFSQSFARRPTGYYLAAGDVAKVTVPAAMVNKGFEIRVGANVHDKYIKSTIERPFRVSNRFPIVSEVTEIANPYGGGIYIDVPYLASAGTSVDVKIQNAVPAPLFSSTALNPTTLAQWLDTQRNNPAPWADFVSDKYMMTVPTSWIYAYADPVALMRDWDARMDVVSDLVGRDRIRNNQILYAIVDTSLYGDGFGIGYPTGNNDYKPADMTDGNRKQWLLITGKSVIAAADSEFHELGHAQLFSNFDGEGEAAINLLYVAVSNKLYGNSIDEALGESMGTGPFLGREVAAVNWMVTPNFRAGKAMDITNSEKNEVRYQQRGYAKYVEVAALFGWDKLEKFWAEENRVAQLNLAPAGAGLSATDSRILRMSIAAGVDLTPLIHFWGVQPVNSVALRAAVTATGLPSSPAVYDRLKRYQALIPMSNAAFQAHAGKFLNKPVAQISGANKSPDYGEGWYAVWLNTYAANEGQAAQTAMNAILGKYFPAGRP